MLRASSNLWLAHCFRYEHPELGTPTYRLSPVSLPQWLATVSLINPAPKFVEMVKQFEIVFHGIHGSSVSKDKCVISGLVDKLSQLYPDIPLGVIKNYSPLRTHTRLKYLDELPCKAKKEKQEERKSKQEEIKSKQESSQSKKNNETLHNIMLFRQYSFTIFMLLSSLLSASAALGLRHVRAHLPTA
jgi:hypothetical protein